MDKKYIIMEGNEFGIIVDVDTETKFVTLKEAEEEYDKIFDENDGYGAAVIFEVTSTSLKPIKFNHNM